MKVPCGVKVLYTVKVVKDISEAEVETHEWCVVGGKAELLKMKFDLGTEGNG